MKTKTKKIAAVSLAGVLACSLAVSAVITFGGSSVRADDSNSGLLTAETSEDTNLISENTTDGEALKDETVYVISNPDGTTKKLIVSDQLKNMSAEAAKKEASKLDGATSVKGDEDWQGTVEKELPVELKITYKLDGKTVTADELAGKSGHVVIRYDYTNKQYEMKTINGVSEKIYVPFAVLTGTVLDNDVFSNVEIKNGKSIDDGDKTIVAGIAFPGLQENLAISKDDFEIPSYVEISADVTDFELTTTLTVASNNLFNDAVSDSDELGGFDLGELSDGIDKLTDAMDQLIDGSTQLYDGLATLYEKTGELSNGVDSLASGLAELDSNSSSLTAGAYQVFTSLLSSADDQLEASGLERTGMTPENYNEALDNVLMTLDSAGTIAEQTIRTEVEKQVRAKTDTIKEAVTAVVKQNVTDQVTAQVKSGAWTKILSEIGYTPETWEAGIADGTIPEAQQTQVTAQLDAYMKSDAATSTIAANVETYMNSDDIKATIETQTENQVQAKIAETMASDEIQAKIMEITKQASEGAVKIRALKQQLDSYNAFYLGVIAYTDGVSQAAAGASTLQGYMPELESGVAKLKDGADQLREGLKQLNEEGIQKLVDVYTGDIETLSDRLDATSEVSKNYKSFSGLSDKMDGTVKFIYRTESIGK